MSKLLRKQPTNLFHPGEILLEEFLSPSGVTQVAFAERWAGPRRATHKALTSQRTYCLRWENDPDSHKRRERYYEFQTCSNEGIKQIVPDAVVSHESLYRDSIIWRYERDVEIRNGLLSAQEHQREIIARRNRKAVLHLLKTRDDLITSAITGMKQADRIRELVAVIKRKSAASRRPIKNLDRWVRWAIHHADTIDTRHMSVRGLDAWIAKFKLKH